MNTIDPIDGREHEWRLTRTNKCKAHRNLALHAVRMINRSTSSHCMLIKAFTSRKLLIVHMEARAAKFRRRRTHYGHLLYSSTATGSALAVFENLLATMFNLVRML